MTYSIFGFLKIINIAEILYFVKITVVANIDTHIGDQNNFFWSYNKWEKKSYRWVTTSLLMCLISLLYGALESIIKREKNVVVYTFEEDGKMNEKEVMK